MIIVAGGDSFVWGSELADCLHSGPNGYSRNTFTALLADANYICAAYPGIGNREIKSKVINVCKSLIDTKTEHIVIVCWTWPSRDSNINSDNDILELQNFLNLNNIPYLFICADNCIITDNPKINWDNWYFFPPGVGADQTTLPRGFYQWAIENKYNVGVDSHPLEQAHRDAGKLIKEKFDELVKKYIQ